MQLTDFKVEKRQNGFNLFGRIKLQILLIAAFAVVALFFGQLVFANKLATDGEKLAGIEDQIRKLQEENSSLQLAIAKEGSLKELSKKAQNLGFEPSSQVIVPRSLLH